MLRPIASSTWEGSRDPDAQAEPLDAATPARSRAISMSSPFRPENAAVAKFGRRLGAPVSVPPNSRKAERNLSLWACAAAAATSRQRDHVTRKAAVTATAAVT